MFVDRVSGVDQPMGDSNALLITLHQDLYQADYIIHEVAAETGDRLGEGAAASLGCALP